MKKKVIAGSLVVALAIVPLMYFQDYFLLRDVKENVAKSLKDPDSANFSDVEIFRAAGVVTACGLVNGKNALGAYSGFDNFMTVKGGKDIKFGGVLFGEPAKDLCDTLRTTAGKAVTSNKAKTAWYIETERDDYRKRKYVYGSVNTTNAIETVFSVACQRYVNGEKDFFLSIKTKDFLGESEDYGRGLYYIIDSDDPRRQNWIYSNNGAYYASETQRVHKYENIGANISDFIKKLKRADTLRIRATTYRYEEKDYRFEVSGFDEFYNKIEEECGKT